MCKQCYDRDYAQRNRPRLNEVAREWASRNPEKIKDIGLRYKYGIDTAKYQDMYTAQKGKCAVCKKAEAKDVDHNHDTGEVRALLCGDCNRGLGLFKEDETVLLNAITYIGYWKEQ